MTQKPNYWIFANKAIGEYEDSDWDTSTILRTKHYYFPENEKNRMKVKEGDVAIFREYGSGYWGTCVVGEWVPDPDGPSKYEGTKTGWFEISKIKKWSVPLPQSVIWSELSNQNHRLRIAKATQEDKEKIELALKIYKNLGYGSAGGEFFILENGLEEAVKKNLSQLNLTLADDSINQQCTLEVGIGRTDLICLDEDGNYVVIELKLHASDEVIGQIMRYMGYIREKWADREEKDVKGIIIAQTFDDQLRYAAREANVRVLRVRIG